MSRQRRDRIALVISAIVSGAIMAVSIWLLTHTDELMAVGEKQVWP